MIIRKAKIEDLISITGIYNEAIENTVATFDTTSKTFEEQKNWFTNHGPKNPILVAEKEENILGWASLSRWSDRCAYSDTAELSLYIKETYHGQGIGRKLLEAIIQEGKKAGLHTVISRITEEMKQAFIFMKLLVFFISEL